MNDATPLKETPEHSTPRGSILAASLGECVHIGGIVRFLTLAQEFGYGVAFTGPATPIDELVRRAVADDPDIIAVSYRLTPELAARTLREFKQACVEAGIQDKRFIFGGTPPTVTEAARLGLFEETFSESDPPGKVSAWLQSRPLLQPQRGSDWAQTVVDRIAQLKPFPLIRHHFGIPADSIEPTVRGIRTIAESGCLDVLSLGADQVAQESFFRPEQQNMSRPGAGGVPFRSEDDLRRLYKASRAGNFPLMRSYSGTSEHIRYAEMLRSTIDNAWCATSLFWFNAMDGRGPSPLATSIREHIELMAWHGARQIPVEGNEPYHWGLRDGPDVVVCAASYIYAYVAKKAGVRDYISTYMFETPPFLSDRMDLAKALAQVELAESFSDDSFRVIRQTRTGLYSHPVDPDQARAHLASSIYLQCAIQPSILHVVGYTEADHAVDAKEVIESCKIARRVAERSIRGGPSMAHDPAILDRSRELVRETKVLLAAILKLGRAMGYDDPLNQPEVLAQAVRIGLLDAPQLKGNPFARGEIRTKVVGGAVVAVDRSGTVLSERERTSAILEENVDLVAR